MLATPLSDVRLDATGGKRLAVRRRIVGTVCLNQAGFVSLAPAFAGDRNHAINQWEQ